MVLEVRFDVLVSFHTPPRTTLGQEPLTGRRAHIPEPGLQRLNPRCRKASTKLLPSVVTGRGALLLASRLRHPSWTT